MTNGPRTYGLRRPDQVHDLELVAPRVEREPHDVGHGQRRGDRQHRPEHQADARITLIADSTRVSHCRS